MTVLSQELKKLNYLQHTIGTEYHNFTKISFTQNENLKALIHLVIRIMF